MLTLLGLLIAAQAASAAPHAPTRCDYDRDAMLALDQRAFDQDFSGGWRALANAGCEAEAADLIRDWREAHRSDDFILFWHEGQLRADIGQTRQAIALFEKSRKPAAEDAQFGWNLYFDGSVAFLRRDRAELDVARDRLAVLPMPDDLKMVGPDGKPVQVAWPMNLNVLDAFQRCWGKTYKQAYACAVPIRRIEIPDPSD
jgi:hypothetical protein